MQTWKTHRMKQQLFRVAAMLCLAACSAVAADAPPSAESVMTMRVNGEIAIDPQGKVLDYRLDTKLQPELQQLIAKAVPNWTFFPIVIEGKPVAAKTRMRITLAGKSVGAAYKINIDNVIFHGDEVGGLPAPAAVALSSKVRKPAPKYPKFAVNGLVLVYVRASLDGKIEDAIAGQSSLFNAKGTPEQLAAAIKAMEDSAVFAIKQWTLNVETHGKNPSPEDLTATISVHYMLGGSQQMPLGGGWRQRPASDLADKAGQWRFETRGEMRRIPWLRDARSAQQIGVSDVEGGEMSGLSTPFKLRDGAIGKVL